MSPRDGGFLGCRCPRRRLDPTNGGWGRGNLVLCAKGVLPGARVLALLRSWVLGLPALQGATSPLCLPSK